jgi:hypothetical protein
MADALSIQRLAAIGLVMTEAATDGEVPPAVNFRALQDRRRHRS